MATTSPRLLLRLPEGPDTVNVDTDLSANFTKIDNAFGAQTPTTLNLNDIADIGVVTKAALTDHIHGGLVSAVPSATGSANSEGVALTISRSDHVHQTKSVYLNHGPESFDINVGTTEDLVVQCPITPTAATLILRGRALVAGLLPAHTHTATTGNASAVHAHVVSLEEQALTGTTAAGSSHGHAASTNSAEAAHTHTGSTGTGSNHNHSINNSGTHNHSLSADNSAVGQIQIDAGHTTYNTNEYIEANGDHSHGGSVGNEGSHTHGFTTGGGSSHTHTPTIATEAAHTHTFTTNTHFHNISSTLSSGNLHTHDLTTASAGSGGFTATSRPATITVVINGTLRATVTGSASDWDSSTDILAYMTSPTTTITLGCSTGGRLKAQVFQVL